MLKRYEWIAIITAISLSNDAALFWQKMLAAIIASEILWARRIVPRCR